jgi:hypothetical protein
MLLIEARVVTERKTEMAPNATRELAQLEYGAARQEHERRVAWAHQRRLIRQSQPPSSSHVSVRNWITAVSTATSIVVSAFVVVVVL